MHPKYARLVPRSPGLQKGKKRLFFLKPKFFKKPLLITICAVILLMSFQRFLPPSKAYAAPWSPTHGSYLARKQLTLVNNSGQTFESGTTYKVTIDTQALVSSGSLLTTCDDLRIVYQPSDTTAVELKRNVEYASTSSGVTTCATSSATQVVFQLQADMSNGSNTSYYYLYYDNTAATTYPAADALAAYNVGSKTATFVAPFNGTTTALAAGSGTPTTATGAIRYSGGKSAIEISGTSRYVNFIQAPASALTLAAGAPVTIEAWVYSKNYATGDIQQMIVHGANANANLGISTSGSFFFTLPGTTSLNSSGGPNPLNTWVHVAAVYTGTTKYIFINGILRGTATNQTTTATSPYTTNIGSDQYSGNQHPIYTYNGLVDEVRISNVARYTSNFTPSTSPFVRDEKTMALYHMDETGQDPRGATGVIYDDSGNNRHAYYKLWTNVPQYYGYTTETPVYASGLTGVDNGGSDTGYQSSQSYASRNGVFIEEGTTNKITNPSYEHATWSQNWSDFATTLNSNTYAFTAGTAKRKGYGSFAKGIYIVGQRSTWYGDKYAVAVGTAVHSNFSNGIDGNQGTFSFWITPEWNGNDNQLYILANTGNRYFDIEKSATNKLTFYNSGWTYGVDVSSWTAGTTHYVAMRWDSKNKIDGTNYACITIDTTTTCGQTTAGAAFTLGPAMDIGSYAGLNPANALISGFTLYRRVLYDGTYGTNVGNGNELSLIYNSGAGKDSTEVTGVWDATFAAPTNTTSATITDIPGHSWIFPSTSNLLWTSTTNTGGYMANGTYTSDAWADEGTPTSVVALATTEKIFKGGYKTTSDAANEGIYYAKTVTGGDKWVARAITHSDGTCVPRLVLYNNTDATEIGHIDGTSTSTLGSPNVLTMTGVMGGSGSKALRYKLVNTASSGTCYWHQAELFTNTWTDPSFEIGTAVTDVGTPTTSVQSATQAHSGTNSWKVISDATGEGIQRAITTTSGNFYAMGGFVYADTAGTVKQTVPNFQNGTTTELTSSGNDAWKHLSAINRASAATSNLSFLSNDSQTFYVDDVYSVALSNTGGWFLASTQADAAEATGMRVAGRAKLSQPAGPSVTTTSGTYKWKYTPRHSAANALAFSDDNTVAYIADLYGDSNNYIRLYWSAANTMKLEYNMNGGGDVSSTWDATGAIAANTTYNFQISYTGSGNMVLNIGGVDRITLSSIPVAFSTAPSTIYWGSKQTGDFQADGQFASNSVVSSANTTGPYYKFGTKSAKLVAAVDDNYTTSIDAGNTNSHTLSAYVYDGTSGNVGGTMASTIAVLVFNGATQTTTYTDMGAGWWRLSYTAAAGSGAQNYGVQVKAGKTIYVDGVQLEEKANTTTYIDGTLGTGYAWSGTAHDSTSTRTVSDVQYPIASNISASTGSISLWLKTPWAGNDSVEHTIFDTQTSAGTLKLYKTSANNLVLYDGTNSATKAVSWTAGQWQHIVGTYTSGALNIYVNSVAGTPAGSYSAPTLSTSMFMGQDKTNASLSDATLSNFKIYSSVLTSTEITDLYNAGLGSQTSLAPVATERYTDGQPPVVVWHLDEGYGTSAYDSTLQLNHGTISGATFSEDSNGGTPNSKSLKFDGIDDKISRTYANDSELNPGTNNFSVSTWFKSPSTITGTDTLLSRYNGAGYKLYMNSSGYVCFGIDDDSTWSPDDSACTTVSFADSSWHQALAVKGTSSIILYIDGVERATDTTLSATSSLSGSNPTFYAGIDSDGTSNPWAGFMDEIRVYDSQRSETQVNQEYIARGTNKGVSASLGGEGAAEGLDKGLVGYWKMDEASGDAVDASGNGNTLANLNTTPFTGGVFGNAANLTATSSQNFWKASNSTLQTGDLDYTLSTWFYANNVSGEKMIVGKGWYSSTHEFYIYLSNSTLYLDVWNGNVTKVGTITTTGITAGSWHHLVAWHDSVNNKVGIVVDNSVPRFANTTGAAGANANNFVVGATCSNGGSCSRFFDGKIDEVRYYKRVLSPAEVRALYEYAPGPVAHYKMDEGSWSGNGAVIDSSGNSNALTHKGNAQIATPGKFGKGSVYDGTGDYLCSDANTDGTCDDDDGFDFGTNSFSVEGWFKRPTTGAQNNLVTKAQAGTNAGYKVYMASDGDICFDIDDDSTWTPDDTACTTAATYDDNKWHYFSAVKNGVASISISIDGVLITTDATIAATATLSSDDPLYIGIDDNASSNPFTGNLDDIKFYNYARNQKQIVQDMNAGHPAVGSPVGSPIAYYKFDEGADNKCAGGVNDVCNSGNGGSALDGAQSGMSVPATATSGWTNSGKLGKAMNFDSGADYVDLGTGSNLSITGDLSISVWVKPTSIVGTKEIVGREHFNSEYAMGLAGSEVYLLHNNSLDTWLTTGANIRSGVWQHITVIRQTSPKIQKYYVNGKYIWQNTYTNTVNATSNHTVIGRRDVVNYPFVGSIDEVKIYNYALSEDEIKLDYNQGKAIVMGNTGTASDGKTADNSASRAYCPPGNIEGNCAAGQNPAPVAEWKMDEGSGTTTQDTSGNNNTGTLTNGPTWTNGKQGKAVNFDNSNDYVDTADIDVTSGTFQAWIKRSSVGGRDTIMGETASGSSLNKDHSYHFEVFSDNKLLFIIGNGTTSDQYSGTSSTIDTNWHFVTVTFNGSTMQFYIDGIKSGASFSQTVTPADINTSFKIGKASFATLSGLPFGGLIDQARVYNYARTPAQIAWDYNQGEPVVQYKFNECSGTTINNSVPSANGEEAGNNGTLTVGASGTQTSAGTCSSGNMAEAWNNGTIGKISTSISFDGTDDYVATSNTALIASNSATYTKFSWGGWFYPSSSPTSDTLMHKGNEFRLTTDASAYPQCEIYSGSWQPVSADTTALPVTTWSHVLCTFDGANIKLYVNGVLKKTLAETDAITSSSSTALSIGRDSAGSGYFDGKVDDVRIWNYDLTQTQVRDAYNNGAVSFK